jgi:hypothetical protein
MAKSIGTLTLDLVARIGGFEKGMDQAARISEKRLQQIATQAAAVGNALGTYLVRGIDKAAGTLWRLTKGAIDNADELGKLSQKVGIAADDLSKLQYAAKLADVDTAALQTALVKISKSAVDAADGTGDAAAAFKALSVDVKDSNGQIKSSYDLLLETADAFSQYEDGAEKTAAAVAIFSKAGADMIPLLNGGAAAIREAGDELERLGGVVTPEAARQAEAFNDNLTRLQTSVTGLGNELSIELLPTLVKLTDRFIEFNKEAKDSEALSDGLEVAIRGITGVAITAGNAFQFLADNAAAWAALAGAVLSGNFSGAVDIAKHRLEDLKTDINDVRHAFDGAGKAADEVAASIKNFAPDLTGVPTLADLFGGGKKGKLGFSDEKNKETQATKELTAAERQFNNEIEARISILEELKKMADELKESESRQTDIGLDAAANIDEEIKRIEGLGSAIEGLNAQQLEFANNFGGAFAAYSDSISNISATIGGDLVSALDAAIYRTADLAANTLLWGEGGTEALKALGRSIITDVVSSLIKVGLQMAANAALQATLGTTMAAATTAFAGAATAAWTPAAIGASIATLGGAGPIGLSSYLSALVAGETAALAAGAAGGGFAEGGFTGHGPLNEVAGVVHRGEYVLSNDMLKSLDQMPSGGGIVINNNAPGIKITPRGRSITIDMLPELLDMIDGDQAARAETQLGRNFRATASKLGTQPSANR